MAGQYDQALTIVSDLRDSDPSTPGLADAFYQAHLAYGRALLDRGELDASYDQFGKALAVRPHGPAASQGQKQVVLTRRWQAMEAAWESDEDAAVAALDEIIRLDPSYRDARQKLYAKRIGRADRHLADGKPHDAYDELQAAQTLLPNRPEARQRLVPGGSPSGAVLADTFDNPAIG